MEFYERVRAESKRRLIAKKSIPNLLPCPHCGEKDGLRQDKEDEHRLIGIHVGPLHSMVVATQCVTCKSHGPAINYEDPRIGEVDIPATNSKDDHDIHNEYWFEIEVRATVLAIEGWNTRWQDRDKPRTVK